MKFYISMGDPNGIGLQIALQSHAKLKQKWKNAQFLYGIDEACLQESSMLLGLPIAHDFYHLPLCEQDLTALFDLTFPDSPVRDDFLKILKPFQIPPIKAGEICEHAGLLSAKSFLYGILLAHKGEVNALITLPVHKQAWAKADIPFKGHTELLRALYQQEVIMALGCQEMLMFLYTDHIALADVSAYITTSKLYNFLALLLEVFPIMESCGVLGLNPHASDNGLMGHEEAYITEAIKQANHIQNIFKGPLVPDTAFSPQNRQMFKYFVAMYHDQGLIPLKALYFEESVNISLGLPIIRVSVDHGTAFDKSYKKQSLSCKSYENTFELAHQMILKRRKS